MQMFKCCICSDPYIDETKPSYCPFCGAPEKYIVPVKDLKQVECENISDLSKANLEHALLQENNRMLFYACSYEVSMDAGIEALFRVLERIEAKHASIIRSLLNVPDPQEVEDNRGRCHALEQLNIKDAHEKQEKAVEFYKQAAETAEEVRVKEVFSALAEIEARHAKLVEDVKNRFAMQPDFI